MAGVRLHLGFRLVVLAMAGAWCSPAAGNINLELRAGDRVGNRIEVGLYAVSDDETDQSLTGMDVVFHWDPTVLFLAGKVDNGPFAWTFSTFPLDALLDGINADCSPKIFCPGYTRLPFNDGDAFYQAVVLFVDPPFATPAGLLVTTFLFDVLAPVAGTTVAILSGAGQYTHTQVLASVDGAQGVDVTGSLGALTMSLALCGERGDFNGDCLITLTDVADYAICMDGPGVLPVSGCEASDVDGDDDGDLADFRILQLLLTDPP